MGIASESNQNGIGNLGTRNIGILIADDFESWRVRVRQLLQARPDWRVVGEACDGLQAVQMAEELKPDVILLDIGMPDVGGIEAAQSIRRVSPTSRIVFLTQLSDQGFVDAAFAAGADEYVVKANAAGELIPAIMASLRYAAQ